MGFGAIRLLRNLGRAIKVCAHSACSWEDSDATPPTLDWLFINMIGVLRYPKNKRS